MWEDAAVLLHGHAKVAGVNVAYGEKIIERFSSAINSKPGNQSLKGYPAVIVLPPGEKKDPQTGEWRFQNFTIPTGTSTTAEDIKANAMEILHKAGVPVEIPELVSRKSLKSCTAHRWCAVATMKHLYDNGADGRNRHLSVLQQVAGAVEFRGTVGFAWVQAGNQPRFDQHFHLQQASPLMVVMNTLRGTFTTHQGKFEAAALRKTIRKMQLGRAGLHDFDIGKLPWDTDTEPWDGSDYEPPPEEDGDYDDVELEADVTKPARSYH